MDSRSIIYLVAAFFGAAPLVFGIVVRGAVRRSRQEYVDSLREFFRITPAAPVKAEIGAEQRDTATQPGQPNSIAGTTNRVLDDDPISSLEFLKFKYDPERREFSLWAWSIAGFLLFFLLFLVLSFALVIARNLPCKDLLAGALCFETYFQTHPSVSLTLLASILGAYTYLFRAFHQAIENFDLAPASFFGAASNFIFAIVVTQIAIVYLAKAAADAPTATGLLMVTAFIGAYMPDDILRYFLSLSSIRQLKQERSDFGREIESIPIEVLDGIDSKVRYRLSEFHIESIQNLASANPLMLFVETPYGFYQTLDWVSQAQLCASVGPDATFKLWKLGIRTIFDLERAALSSDFVNEDLLHAIERIILPDLASPTPWNSAAIVASVRIRLDGSDTRRLRQIVLRVNERLGGQRVTSLPEKG